MSNVQVVGKIALVGLMMTWLATAGTRAAKGPGPIQAREMLAHAAELRDIRHAEAGSFKLMARLSFMEVQYLEAKGAYALLWQDPDSWREEVVLPGSRLLRVTRHGETDVAGLMSSSAGHAVDLLWGNRGLQLQDDEVIRKSRFRDWKGHRAVSLKIGGPSESRSIVLDAEAHDLLAVETDERRIEFSQHVGFGGRRFPQRIILLRDKRRVGEVQVVSLEAVTDVPPSAFFMPSDLEKAAEAGAAAGPVARGTVGLDPPKLLHHVRPKFPRQALLTGGGVVLLRVVIDKEGKVGDISVLETTLKSLEASAIKAVSKWRYQPGRLDGVIVPVTMTVRLEYSEDSNR